MKCPYCRSRTSEVFNSRTTKYGAQIWRRRRCAACRRSFTTYESPDLGFLRVATNAGSKTQPYSRARLYMSIYQAFAGSGASAETVDAVTATAETKLLDLKETELTHHQINEVVLQTLRHFNTAAFVHYLSARTPLMSEAQLRRELKKY